MALTIAPNLSQLMAEFHSSEDCVPLMRNSTLSDQPWEHPNDEAEMIDIGGYCKSPQGQDWGIAQDGCSTAGGAWTIEECNFTFKGHILKENNTGPHRIPAGWRVTKNGHLTNLPIDMDATNRADALSKGIGVITEFNDDCPNGYGNSSNESSPCMGTIADSEGNITGISSTASHSKPKWKWIRPSATTDRMNTETQHEGANGESDYLKWAISEVTETSATPDNYWWVESPKFTAACPAITPDFMGDYWDETYCAKKVGVGNETLEGEIPWKFIGPVVGIVALTMIFTVYGGGA